MSSCKELKSLKVLVTRPKPQGEILCNIINERGGNAIFFPTIEIAPPNDPAAFQENISHLNQYDWAIFISPQAVYKVNALPSTLKIAAVGAGTAQALRDKGLRVDVYPNEEWNTEGLLALSEFHNVAGKKIALIKGENGRELLANELSARGATVTPMLAYRRILPQVDVKAYLDLLRRTAIDVIICTSIEGLENLKTLLAARWSDLQNVRVTVISERMMIRARELDFRKIALAKNASHEAILEVLLEGK